MATSMFDATAYANEQITATFDMVWALDAGLWNLRQATTRFLQNHSNATNKQLQDSLIPGLRIHGLNPMRIAVELSWEYEEQYIAGLLLINATAIFDSWVDSFVDAAVTMTNKRRKSIKKKMKEGDFSELDNALAQEKRSSLAGCFHLSHNRQDKYIDNLRLIYKYFKSCRNCVAHGDQKFSSIAETNYKAINNLTRVDCGIKEFPKIEPTIANNPLKMVLRGVVGFYDVMIRIIYHYDCIAAEKEGADKEILKRWKRIPSITLSPLEKKRNSSIRAYMSSHNMCSPYVEKTSDVYNFLVSNNAIHKT